MSTLLPLSKKRSLRESQNTDLRNTKHKNRSVDLNLLTINPSVRISSLKDLLNFAWRYVGDSSQPDSKRLSERLWRLIPVLTDLDRMVGLEKVKSKIVEMVQYQLLGYSSPNDMLHTILSGAPGSGKTRLAGILARVYYGAGLLSTPKVIIAKRSDFLGKYVGHTESKTEKLLQSSLGGVLFIDEAYSMGCNDKTDSFSKAAIDLLNQFLTENAGNVICIIAGYEKELEESFFSVNPGLQRRFPIKFQTGNYTHSELAEIFRRKIRLIEWRLSSDITSKDVDVFFKEHAHRFPFSGGDIDNFIVRCKYAHSSRIFGTFDVKTRKVITLDDMRIALDEYISKSEEMSESIKRMYI